MKPGDWFCVQCNDLNFATRSVCRKCNYPKPDRDNRREDFHRYNEGGYDRGYQDIFRGSYERGRGSERGGYGRGYERGFNDRGFHFRGEFSDRGFDGDRGADYPDRQYDGDYDRGYERRGFRDSFRGRPRGRDFGSKFGYRRPYDNTSPERGKYSTRGLRNTERRQGDWDCPQCSELNFAARNKCRKCNTPRPEHLGKGGRPGDWVCFNCEDLNFASRAVCRKCGRPNSLRERSLSPSLEEEQKKLKKL